MPLHFQLRREEEFGAINGLKGNPLATRSLVTVLPRVKLAQSPSPLSPPYCGRCARLHPRAA